jgi:tetratricopeptide (TPR) repeat protein
MTLTQRDRLLASARMERAMQQRKAGNLQEAYDDYGAAVKLLRDASSEDELRLRALVLQNFSNTVEDAGQHQDALELIRSAIADLRAVKADDAAADEQFASALRNGAEKLFKEGDYDQALECAVLGLERYRALVGQGRSDLADDMATLQGVHAFTLERLFDIDAAIDASQAALAALERSSAAADESRRETLVVGHERLESLKDLRRSGPGDVPTWLERVRGNLEIGAALMNERRADEAGRFFEEALTTGVYLGMLLDDSDALLEIIAESGLRLATAAYYASRPVLAWRGGTYAIKARRRLVEQHGRRDLVDQLGGTYTSVVSIMAHFGRDKAVDTLFAEMRECLAALDRTVARKAAREARKLVDQARKTHA